MLGCRLLGCRLLDYRLLSRALLNRILTSDRPLFSSNLPRKDLPKRWQALLGPTIPKTTRRHLPAVSASRHAVLTPTIPAYGRTGGHRHDPRPGTIQIQPSQKVDHLRWVEDGATIVTRRVG